jgi:hypothetical protein
MGEVIRKKIEKELEINKEKKIIINKITNKKNKKTYRQGIIKIPKEIMDVMKLKTTDKILFQLRHDQKGNPQLTMNLKR